MNNRAIFVGRFQPFHLGHLKVVNLAFKEGVEELIIVIGSAEDNHTLRNPFTAGERFEMIRDTLTEYKKIEIIPISDLKNNSAWVTTIKSYLPPFSIVYTNEPMSKRLFKEEKFAVRGMLRDNKNYSGTNIRELIIKEDPTWISLVPTQVADIIHRIDGVNRLIDLSKKDLTYSC